MMRTTRNDVIRGTLPAGPDLVYEPRELAGGGGVSARCRVRTHRVCWAPVV